MDEYTIETPDFIKLDASAIYSSLYEYGQRTADNFENDMRKKINQIRRHPFSCAVDTVYPVLTEKQVRKAIIFNGRYLLLYLVKGKSVILLMLERAERDYINQFEANLRLYEGNI